MKNLVYVTAALLIAAPTFAATKICKSVDGVSSSGGKSSSTIAIQSSPSEIKVRNIQGEDFASGNFKRAADDVNGRDGKVYLSYLFAADEGGTFFLLDKQLLQTGTKGLLKLRWRGEGYSQTTFICFDPQN